MKILRNKEVLIGFILYLSLGLVGAVLGFIWDFKFGILVIVLVLLLLLIYLLVNQRRYHKIEEISQSIDKLLHGELLIPIEKYEEGEISTLQNEIYKMTVRLKEQQQALQADKEYLAESLANISHQIKTPLTTINLLVNRLNSQENLVQVNDRQKIFFEINNLLKRIDFLVTALLKISKIDAGTVKFCKESIDLSELINKSIEPVLIPIELREQTIKVDASGKFRGDIAWTTEALVNIIKNCMEHTPNGGKIEITGQENALYDQIIIEDNGTGIASEDLPHIFERFYKGQNSSSTSFGIGLALSRMIIKEQNGTIKVENCEVQGTRFTIRFYKE